jgi:pantothenate kinase
MDIQADTSLSPYRLFSKAEWARLRADQPLTLTEEELQRLRSLNDHLSMDEVVEVYLPLSRLLSLYVGATQSLFDATRTFLGTSDHKVPYVIGIAGSVAVGKSTHGPCITGTSGKMAEHTEGFAYNHRRFSVTQFCAGAGSPDEPERLSGKL